MHWLDLLAVQGTLKSLLQHHSSKASFFSAQPSSQSNSHIHTINYVYGLGGRDVKVEDMEHIFAVLKDVIETGDPGDMYRYLGIRE